MLVSAVKKKKGWWEGYESQQQEYAVVQGVQKRPHHKVSFD